MDGQDAAAAGDGAGQDRSKVTPQTKSTKQVTWVFVETQSVTDLRERIVQLTGHASHEEQEKLRTELLEKLQVCKRDTLIELCRSFDITGSRANRKEELVSFLMKFTKDHCSGIDGTNPDKIIKKRRRMKEEENMSSCKPSKKKKREGEEEADERKGVEDGAKYSDHDLMGNRYLCVDNKKGKFPNEGTNLKLSERINGSMSENLHGAFLSEAPVVTDEKAVFTTPSRKLFTTAEGDSIVVKASKKKKASITKKKSTPKEDCNVKSCGKLASKGDTKSQKQTMKPSRDELREAVFLILDTANFATMTFGDVVKEVDKYFGKDLFERKPLIRSLIEEELFRLTEEAEKKELEEEEAAEAKARAEQSAKDMALVQRLELGIDKQNGLQSGQDGKTEDSAKDTNDSTNVAFVEPADRRNSNNVAEGTQDGKSDAVMRHENVPNEFPKDDMAEMVAPNVNAENAVQGSRNGKAETVRNAVDTLECSKDSKAEGASDGENNDTKDGRIEGGRSGDGGNNAVDVGGCEAAESDCPGTDERVDHAEKGKGEEANDSENNAYVEIHGDKDGDAKQGDTMTEPSPTDAGGDSKC